MLEGAAVELLDAFRVYEGVVKLFGDDLEVDYSDAEPFLVVDGLGSLPLSSEMSKTSLWESYFLVSLLVNSAGNY